MTHIDTPPIPFPNHPVPGILNFTGQDDLPVSVLRFGIDETSVDDAVQRRWWADLAFHPFGPPAQDAECTLHFGGTIGRGIIAAGSTRMLGEGSPPTIRMAYVEDEGAPEMTARPEPEPVAPWEEEILDQQAAAIRHENTLAARLDRMLANLQQHIDQRAAEIAQPLIEEARAEVVEAQEERDSWRTRFTDLQREFQRQAGVLKRRANRAETAIARARSTVHLNTAAHLQGRVAFGTTDYQRGYQACADHVTTALNGATDQQEADRG